MCDELVKRLRYCSEEQNGCGMCALSSDCVLRVGLLTQAADAIEEMSRQRDRAYARLCEWCGVCPEEKRNPEDCEIAALNPEPPKEEE